MAGSKPTPEEKLFAVIQGAAHPPLRSRAQAVSLAGFGSQLRTLIGPLDLPRVNQGLTGLLVLVAVWCLINPLLMRPRLDRLLEQAKLRATPFAIAPPLQGLRPFEDYTQLMQQKDPFRVGELAVVTQGPLPDETPPVPAQPDYQGALAKLKLVGIAWGPEPTVMIEETATQQTHFLKPGSSIGPFTVKEILPTRVILRVGEQDFELF